jgi:ABC-type Zn uptake system ZnuABC Zn-binding protein ZnuA
VLTEGPYTGKPNPHAWMSPANAAIYVENIRRSLVKVAPAKVRALDGTVRQKLAAFPQEQCWLVSSERVFSCRCANQDLRPLYQWPINADALGTPRPHVVETAGGKLRVHRKRLPERPLKHTATATQGPVRLDVEGVR